MTTRDQVYDGLAVYGTDGEEYYPDPVDGLGHPAVGEWFLSTGLRCYLDTGQPELMVYLGDVRHPRERNQAFAVYEGQNTETLFTDFERAVRDDLVEKRDWEVLETTASSDQKSLFHFLVGLSSDHDFQPRPLTQYTEYDSELFQRSFSANNTSHAVEPVEVVARDYQIAAELVHTYSDVDPIRIHVYDNQDVQPPVEADLVIKVEPGPYEVKVPPATVDLLDSLQRRLESHKANERKRATVEAIAAHSDEEDDPKIVREAVEEGFEKYYDSFEVITTQRREQIESQLENKQHELHRTNAELESLRAEFESEQRRRKQLERKAKLKELVEGLSNTLRKPLNTGTETSTTGYSTDLELDTGNGSSTKTGPSWKTILSVLLLGVVGLGIGVAVAACPLNVGPASEIASWISSVLGIDLPSACTSASAVLVSGKY